MYRELVLEITLKRPLSSPGSSQEKLNFPAEDIWIGIYNDDDEAYELWNKHIGVPASKIVRLGKEDNFGDLQAIKVPVDPVVSYIWIASQFGEGGKSGPGGSGERFLEFWNLVLINLL